VALSPQLPEHNRELIRTRHLTFEILTDRGNELAAKFGLRFSLPDYLQQLYATFPLDLEKFNGDASWTLPCRPGS
jgi:peroxiredoxin